MHEMSIALSLIDTVTAQAIEAGAERVTRVVVEVGGLSGVVPDALASAFKVAIAREPVTRNAVLDIRPVAVTLNCPACGIETPAVGPAALRCRVCGCATNDVVRGRELDVVSVEVE